MFSSQSGGLGADKPIDGIDVCRVVKATEKLSGNDVKSHDLRQTFITACEQVQVLATV